MEKRRLRVLKRLGTVPAVGTCTSCNREFKVPMTAMKRVADALTSGSKRRTAAKAETTWFSVIEFTFSSFANLAQPACS
jgi:hypothetical protein